MTIDLGSLPAPQPPPARPLTRRRVALDVAWQCLATMCMAIVIGIGICTVIAIIGAAATLIGIIVIPFAVLAGLTSVVVGALYGLLVGGINGLVLGSYAALVFGRRVSVLAFHCHVAALIGPLDCAVAYFASAIVARVFGVDAVMTLFGLLAFTLGGAGWTVYRLGEWYRILRFPPNPAQPLMIYVDPTT